MKIDIETKISFADTDTGIQEIIAEMSQLIADEARRLCPVDTGRLRDSIEVITDGSNAKIIAAVPYAEEVEFGTSKAVAQPFLVPALLNGASALAM